LPRQALRAGGEELLAARRQVGFPSTASHARASPPRTLPDGRVTLPIQTGRCLLAPQRIVAGGAIAPGITPDASWVTGSATVAGQRIPAEAMAVTIDVTSRLHVVLHLTPAG
jgi:hypothetical protein